VAFNPTPFDKSVEMDRLRRKADAGAHVVYTQPVFEAQLADFAVEACRSVGLPCFVGVLPLRNSRHCEFMHNEVPGISIPKGLRKRMSDAPDDETALAIGVEEARDLARHIRSCAQGLYLMPPANDHLIAEQVLDAVR
jgi:homocysteine S-methyltransferase